MPSPRAQLEVVGEAADDDQAAAAGRVGGRLRDARQRRRGALVHHADVGPVGGDRQLDLDAPRRRGEPCSIALVRASVEASSTRPAPSAGHSSRVSTQASAERTNDTTVRSAGTRRLEWTPGSRDDLVAVGGRASWRRYRRYTTELDTLAPPPSVEVPALPGGVRLDFRRPPRPEASSCPSNARTAHRRISRAAARGASRGAAVLGRPRHVGDAQVDPGRVRRRGRRALHRPRAAGRRLRRRAPEGPRPRRRREPRGGRQGGVRARLRGPGDPRQRAATRAATRCSPRSAARCWPSSPATRRTPTAADTIAHGCTGKGNDQVRIEATIATIAPDLKVIAPVREWQMGRDEEIAYAIEHGIPISSSVERPYSIDDNLWGRSSEGGVIEDLDQPPPDDVFQLVTLPRPWRPTAPRTSSSASATACRSALDGEELGAGGADPARRRGRLPQRRRDPRPHRGPRRRPQGARPLRGARRRGDPHRPPRAREAGLHRPRERPQAERSTRSGRSSPTRASGTSRCSPTSTPSWTGSTSASRAQITMRLYKGSATAVTRSLAQRDLRPQPRDVQRRRLVLAGRGARLHRALLAPEPDGVPDRAGAGEGMRRGGPPMLPVDPASVPPFSRVERGAARAALRAGRRAPADAAGRAGRAPARAGRRAGRHAPGRRRRRRRAGARGRRRASPTA